MPRRRRTKKTRLIYCEGAQDKAFLDSLKPLYTTEQYNVDIKRGTGGDQTHLVEEAARKGRAYDQTYLKVDGDRPTDEMAAADGVAGELAITIIRTTPSLERLLLSIIEPDKRTTSWSAVKLKHYFEKQYIPETKRTDTRAYSALFTKEVIEEARGRLEELEGLVGLFL